MFTEPTFCRNSSINISIGNRYYNRFINLGRLIFSLNHCSASAATVFTISTTFGIAHAPCYTRAERATQSAARVGSSLFDFLTVSSTQYVHKIIFTFSPICKPSRVQSEPAEPAEKTIHQPTTLDLVIEAHRGLLPVYELNWTELNCRACKNPIAIYLIIMRDLIFFFSASSRISNPPLSLLVGCDSNGRQRNQPCDCAMTWAFHVHQKICRIKISQQFIYTFGRNITLLLEYLGPVAVVR